MLSVEQFVSSLIRLSTALQQELPGAFYQPVMNAGVCATALEKSHIFCTVTS
jgi:hypothetical protein